MEKLIQHLPERLLVDKTFIALVHPHTEYEENSRQFSLKWTLGNLKCLTQNRCF